MLVELMGREVHGGLIRQKPGSCLSTTLIEACIRAVMLLLWDYFFQKRRRNVQSSVKWLWTTPKAAFTGKCWAKENSSANEERYYFTSSTTETKT